MSGFPDVLSDGDLMPVRCYSCGTSIRQLAIESALKRGVPLKQVLDELGYSLLCCSKLIQSQVSVVAHLKAYSEPNKASM